MNIPPNVLHSECSEHIEARMAEDVISYISEIVKARGMMPEAVSRIVASVVASFFTDKDASLHVEGMRFSKDVQDCMCKCIDGVSK